MYLRIIDKKETLNIKGLSFITNKKQKLVFTYDHRAISSQSTKVG